MDADGFDRYVPDVYHCLRCHRIVDTSDANDDADRRALLDAHTALLCRTDPATTLLPEPPGPGSNPEGNTAP